MTVHHKFTCSVVVRNLGADLLGDENQGHLPRGFAMRLMMAMLRHDATELQNIYDDMTAAGWRYFMANDLDSAQMFKRACDYINTAAQTFDRACSYRYSDDDKVQ